MKQLLSTFLILITSFVFLNVYATNKTVSYFGQFLPGGNAEEKPVVSEKKPSVATEKLSNTNVVSETPWTGTFDIASNYVWRGVSQSNNLPAFQGGLTYTFKRVGLYLTMWGSNVYFFDHNGDPATVELDGIIGINNDIGEHFNYDVSAQHYHYPKTSGLNYNEYFVNITFYFLTALLAYTNDVYGSDGNGTYYNIGVKFDIPEKYFFKIEGVTFSAGYGHYKLPSNHFLRSYNDYNAKISKTSGIYEYALTWTDTNGRSTDNPSLSNNKLTAIIAAYF